MKLIAGVDEVGRGALAGPVGAAAVILPAKLAGLADSKTISPAKRVKLSAMIQQQALAWSVAYASVEEIDRLNILNASLLAMKRAVLGLAVKPTLVQIDGMMVPDLNYQMEAIVGGDKTVAVISAASILAKVARDQKMREYDLIYPEYGFSRHKGYGTPEHLLALKQFGATSIHRSSFSPVKKVVS